MNKKSKKVIYPERKKILKKDWLNRSMYAPEAVALTDFFRAHVPTNEIDYLDPESVKDAVGKFCLYNEQDDARWKWVFQDLQDMENSLTKSLFEKMQALAKYRARHASPRKVKSINSQ